MELYQAVPESHDYIGPLAKITLIAKGHETDEARSAPLVWFAPDGYTARFYISPKDQEGPGEERPEGKGKGRIVRVTFEDAIRDCWERRYKLTVEERLILDGTALWSEQAILDSAARGFAQYSKETLDKARRKIMASIEIGCRKFRELYEIVTKY